VCTDEGDVIRGLVTKETGRGVEEKSWVEGSVCRLKKDTGLTMTGGRDGRGKKHDERSRTRGKAKGRRDQSDLGRRDGQEGRDQIGNGKRRDTLRKISRQTSLSLNYEAKTRFSSGAPWT